MRITLVLLFSVSSQAITEPANSAQVDGTDDVRLAGHPAKPLIESQPVHSLDGSECMGLDAMHAGGEGFSEKSRVDTVW